MVTPVGRWLLVEMNEEFESAIKIGDKDFFVDTTFELYKNAKQVGQVVQVSVHVHGPVIGKRVWFHHFVPIEENIHNGRSVSLADKELYRMTGRHLYWVDTAGQLFAYEDEDGNVVSYGDKVFVSPVKTAKETPEKFDFGVFTLELLEEGIVEHTNEELRSMGVSDGSRVKFAPDSEYDMDINGKKLYKMTTEDIILVLDEKH